MKINKLSLVGLSIVTLIAVVIGIAAGITSDDADAAPANQNQLEQVITVQGTGTIQADPDIAYVNLGVDTFHEEVQTAVADANARIEAITAALQEAGIAEDDIRTDAFNIFQETFGPNFEGGAETQSRFRVFILLNVTVRDIDAVGSILAAAVDAGANSVNNIQFSIADQSELVAQARAMALKDARARADHIAGELNVNIVAPVSVEEYGNSGPIPVSEAAYGRGGGGGDFPISTGSLSVNANISVTYSFE
jgi:uncharacterized protein YggE